MQLPTRVLFQSSIRDISVPAVTIGGTTSSSYRIALLVIRCEKYGSIGRPGVAGSGGGPDRGVA